MTAFVIGASTVLFLLAMLAIPALVIAVGIRSGVPRDPLLFLFLIAVASMFVFLSRGMNAFGSNPGLEIFSAVVWRGIPFFWCAFFYSYGRELSAERFRQNERFLGAVVDNLLDGFIVLNEQGRIVRQQSIMGRRVMGFQDPDSNINRPVSELVHPDDVQKVVRGFLELIEYPDRPQRLELRGMRGDGSWLWIEVSSFNRLADPGVRGVVCGFRDISDRKEAEAALEKSKEDYRLLVEDLTDSIFTLNALGEVTYISSAIKDQGGYAPEEIIGRQVTEFVHPEDVDLAISHFRRVMEGADPPVEMRLLDRLGRARWVRIADKRLVEDGQAIGVRGLITDVTALKNLQEQLLQAQKMEAVGRLAGGVAHDFNNLLTAIRGYAELARSSAEPGSPLGNHLIEIEKASDRAAELTSQLLAFSRRQVLQPRVIDLNSVVKNLQGMIGRLIGEPIDFRTSLAPDLGRTRADPTQVQQVLLNLALNARDAMPTGGELLIETRNCPDGAFHEGGSPNGNSVALTVSDTGVGMESEIVDRIFEPFFTTKPVGKGTGLGLATVYGIVEQSGGRIAVSSQPGEGSRFTIYFPAVEEDLDSNPDVQISPAVIQGTETILLVEDERSVRDMTCEALERAGFHVFETGSGEEALEQLDCFELPPDLILTDVVLPGIRGFELMEKIQKKLPGIRCLYMSGYSEDTLQLEAGRLREIHYLAKPFTVQALLQKVRRVLDAPVRRTGAGKRKSGQS